MDQLANALKHIAIVDDEPIAIKIQKSWRKYRVRCGRISLFDLPPVLVEIQAHLSANPINIFSSNKDGRINSSLDEQTIIDSLIKRYSTRVRAVAIRMWYDIMVLDYYHGWIPVNIKSSSLKHNDNVGNLAMCAYAYTNADIQLDVSYKNGELSRIVANRLKSKQYNKSHRDYYFIVVNKGDTSDIIINSVRGLSKLTHNANNLPFQIKWAHNREFKGKLAEEAVKLFVACLQKNKPSWQQQFLCSAQQL